MKVFSYNLGDSRFISNFLPADATEVIVYDKDYVSDVSAIYSNLIEGNQVAAMVVILWNDPQSLEVFEIDS